MTLDIEKRIRESLLMAVRDRLAPYRTFKAKKTTGSVMKGGFTVFLSQDRRRDDLEEKNQTSVLSFHSSWDRFLLFLTDWPKAHSLTHLLLSAAIQTPRRKRSTRVLGLTTTGARRAPDAACHAYAGTRAFYIWHPAGHQGRTRGRPGRDTADRGGRSDAIALASRHARAPNRVPCFGSSTIGTAKPGHGGRLRADIASRMNATT